MTSLPLPADAFPDIDFDFDVDLGRGLADSGIDWSDLADALRDAVSAMLDAFRPLVQCIQKVARMARCAECRPGDACLAHELWHFSVRDYPPPLPRPPDAA